jgi:hypothetical protein
MDNKTPDYEPGSWEHTKEIRRLNMEMVLEADAVIADMTPLEVRSWMGELRMRWALRRLWGRLSLAILVISCELHPHPASQSFWRTGVAMWSERINS